MSFRQREKLQPALPAFLPATPSKRGSLCASSSSSFTCKEKEGGGKFYKLLGQPVLSCTVLNFVNWSCEFCVSKLEQEKATLAQSTHEYQPNLQSAPPSLVVCVYVEASGAESALVEKKRSLAAAANAAQGNDGMMGWSMRTTTTAKSSSTSNEQKGEGRGRAGPSQLHQLHLSFSGRSFVA